MAEDEEEAEIYQRFQNLLKRWLSDQEQTQWPELTRLLGSRKDAQPWSERALERLLETHPALSTPTAGGAERLAPADGPSDEFAQLKSLAKKLGLPLPKDWSPKPTENAPSEPQSAREQQPRVLRKFL